MDDDDYSNDSNIIIYLFILMLVKEIPDFVEELDESFNPSAELEKYSDMEKLPEKKLFKKNR